MNYTANDFKKGQPRWCPGCGDHFFLASFQKAMAEIGVPPYETAVISGIGCSSRLPYYVNTYAMQTIHGRAAAIATGAKVVNPDLTIWQMFGFYGLIPFSDIRWQVLVGNLLAGALLGALGTLIIMSKHLKEKRSA